ncbi:MAG: type II/IV secretion system ATPase subunit [Candidatus Aenigmarchaeota archaeon]|nr:type II/IV secretion system ATPase subunit [Candidatus Aenigmarchaeota archaeon]MDW8149512.1 type II/IV secretion system ATPase subunit [Candidatus Aenigmarchaeota archaeon]
MKLRGLLYRKIKEYFKAKEFKELPAFSISKPKRTDQIKKHEDIRKTNETYPLIEPFAYANIKYDEKEKVLVYNLIEPEIKDDEKSLFEKIRKNLEEIFVVEDPKNAVLELEITVKKIIKDLNIKLKPEVFLKFMYYFYRDFLGLNEIQPLMEDHLIEDISCDGINVPVYIMHKVFGSIKTNIVFRNGEYLKDLVIKMAQKAGKYISYAEPLLDATLPDGSRIALSLSEDVTTRGASFTIRKFREVPFSPLELVNNHTCSEEIFAYLWLLIQYKTSMMIIGGTGSGKTSFLNALSMLIPPEAKIISIEDTRELNLLHEHWVPSLARAGFGLPGASGEKYGEVTLFHLLRESFRMNPDYLIVGETRGEETYVMFQAMASGHSSLSTFHATSLETLIRRLTSPPINLSSTLIESLGVIIIMSHAKEKGATARRVKEVIEIVGVDPRTGEVNSNVVYRWNPSTDTFEKVGDSVLLRRIAINIGTSEEVIKNEFEKRKKILTMWKEEGKLDYVSFYSAIKSYYKGLVEIKPRKLLRKEKGIRSIWNVFKFLADQ